MLTELKTWWRQRRCKHEFQAKARIRIVVSDRLGMYRPPKCIHCGLKNPGTVDSDGQQIMHRMFELNIHPKSTEDLSDFCPGGICPLKRGDG